MNLKSHNYLLLNKEGIFPGPEETEENFISRIDQLRTTLPLPGHPLTPQDWQEAHHLLQPILDIQPFWVPAFYQNKKLSLWEGAAIWDCEGISVVQLRNRFKKGQFGLVKREEVLAHEAAHASRMAFRESRFEELLCYQTSYQTWRKYLGPLFRRPWEAAICLSAIVLGWIWGILGFTPLAIITPWLPFCFFLVRLSRDHLIFRRCLKNISPLLKEKAEALAVALRLSDREILLFANASREKIISYISGQSELRWTVIAATYFSL